MSVVEEKCVNVLIQTKNCKYYSDLTSSGFSTRYLSTFFEVLLDSVEYQVLVL